MFTWSSSCSRVALRRSSSSSAAFLRLRAAVATVLMEYGIDSVWDPSERVGRSVHARCQMQVQGT